MVKRPNAARKPAAPAAVVEPVQPPVRQLTADEVAELVQAWDAARTELQAAGVSVAGIQAELDALPPDSDRSVLDAALDTAKGLADAAQAAIDALTPLPEGVTLPSARPVEKLQEIPVGSQVGGQGQSGNDLPAPGLTGQGPSGGATAGTTETAPEPGAVASAPGTHTTASDDDHEGGASNAAGPAADRRAARLDQAASYLDTIIDKGRVMAAAGDMAEARSFLAEHRDEVLEAQRFMAQVLVGIDVEIAVMADLESTAPVEHAVEVTALVASRWRAGRQFGKTPTGFEIGELTADELTALKADPLLTVSEALI